MFRLKTNRLGWFVTVIHPMKLNVSTFPSYIMLRLDGKKSTAQYVSQQVEFAGIQTRLPNYQY